MPFITHIDVTRIDTRFENADTFFPEISEKDWILTDMTDPTL